MGGSTPVHIHLVDFQVIERQPITAPEVSEIRGVNSTQTIRTLLERRMIRVAGRKTVVGSPFLYRTTKEFLVHFGLNSLRDLPPLEEFEETFGVGGAAGDGAIQLSQATLDSVAPPGEREDREERILREQFGY